MTQGELDALPEDGGGLTFTLEERDGKMVRVPHFNGGHALYQGQDDPMSVVDVHGQRWLIGRLDGVLHKRRLLW